MNEKRELARGLFVKSGLNRKEIAEQVNISEKTLRKWIEQGEWEKMKDALQITRPQLLQDAYTQLSAINKFIKENLNGIPNKEMSDAKAVIRKEIEAFSFQPLHKYIEVFEDFVEFLAKNAPAHLTTFASLSQDFINKLNNK